MLRLSGLHTSYGPVKALKGIDIEVREGEIVCLIGSNGAGKSTALMTISGVLKPDRGEIEFEGQRIEGAAPDKIVGLGISQVPEGRRIFPRLSVLENLELGAFTNNAGYGKKLDHIFSLFPVLKERSKQPGGTLSGGEQQMLAIGRALMAAPKMLLLDEPSLGLAPIMVSKIFKTIKEINNEGGTVLLVEQNARAALRLANRAYVLESGTVKLHGTGEDLLHNEEVRKAYLGE
ncbi:MAG: ABC transporter ATP-binding protein [Nitrospirae bacterium]|nr:MAG: ABC transporter ATP-binding protein [Nitrospirota bacterium]